MYLNDIEEYFMFHGFNGTDLGVLMLFLLLYADEIVIMSQTEDGLNKGLLLLEQCCDRWKLTVNTTKTKIMIFQKGSRARRATFKFKDTVLDIVDRFTYLGIVFTTGGAFNCTFESLSNQAMKAIFALDCNLHRFPCISVKHKLDLFDKLVYPILSYGCEVWGVCESHVLELRKSSP